jgi:hypothetical protein
MVKRNSREVGEHRGPLQEFADQIVEAFEPASSRDWVILYSQKGGS